MPIEFQLSDQLDELSKKSLIATIQKRLNNFFKVEVNTNVLIFTPINTPWRPFFSLHLLNPEGDMDELMDCFQFSGSIENRELAKKELEKKPKNLDKLTDLYYTTILKLSFDPPKQLKANIKRAAQKFLKQFPKGSIVLIKKTNYIDLAVAIKAMTVFSTYYNRTNLLIQNFLQTSSLPTSKINFLESRDFFPLALNFGHNSLYGLSFPHQSHQFIFLFGKRLDMLKRNSRSALNNAIKGINSASWRDGTSPYYYNLSIDPGEKNHMQFLTDYVTDLNKFLAFTYDLQNFSNKKGYYDPISHFCKILNFDMMFDLLNGIKSTGNQFIHNKFLFLFLDLFAFTVGKKNSITSLLRTICDPAFIKQIIKNSKIAKLFEKNIYKAFEQIIEDIYLDQDKPKNKEEAYIHVRDFLIYLRNTSHSFDTYEIKPESMLLKHYMNIPKELQEIAFLYMMAFMEDPEFFWQKFP